MRLRFEPADAGGCVGHKTHGAPRFFDTTASTTLRFGSSCSGPFQGPAVVSVDATE